MASLGAYPELKRVVVIRSATGYTGALCGYRDLNLTNASKGQRRNAEISFLETNLISQQKQSNGRRVERTNGFTSSTSRLERPTGSV